MKKIRTILAFLLCVFIAAGCLGCGETKKETESSAVSDNTTRTDTEAITVTDDLGREVSFSDKPERAAALSASFAETWLLAGGNLAAAVHDAWEDYDLDLTEDTVDVGTSMEVSLELLIASRPDLVLASSKTKSQVEIRDTLEKAGIPVLYYNVDGFDDYLKMLEACTMLTGRPDLYEKNGIAVSDQIEKIREKARKAAEKQGEPSILLIRFAASGIRVKGSKGTVLGEMLADLYCENISDGSDLLDNLSLEKIIEADPDYIFMVQQGNDSEGAENLLNETLTGNPAWSRLTAVKEGRVYVMDRTLYHFKPNNRWDIAYEKLETLLYET